MPVSTSVHISQCLNWIIRLNPRSVLDVGCGFGLWGFLCREYLDIINERVQPETWQVRIDGLELFEPYIMPHQRFLYSSIRIADIRDAAANVDRYDLIITGDVIEHLEKHEGQLVLERLYEKADKALLVNIPLGEGWDHPERHGNPGELHRSQWLFEDFLPYPNEHYFFELPCGKYGLFYCPKDCGVDVRVEGLLAAADWQLSQGNLLQAACHARKAQVLAPQRQETTILLTDVAIRSGDPKGAVEVLRAAIQADPSFHYAYLTLAKLHSSLSQPDRAVELLQSLLRREGVAPELRAQAQSCLKSLIA